MSRQVKDEVFWRKDGTAVPVEYTTTSIYEGAAIVGAVVTFRDITERKRMEEEIRHLAHHDALTGLPNRRLFTDILKVELAAGAQEQKQTGRALSRSRPLQGGQRYAGPRGRRRLLKEVARRFRRTIREADTVARIGGDEFNMILSDIARAEDVSDIAQKIIVVPFGSRLCWMAMSCIPRPASASAFTRTTATISETLLRYADIAMYHAKGKRQEHVPVL